VIPISPKHFMFCGLLAGCGESWGEKMVLGCAFFERFGFVAALLLHNSGESLKVWKLIVLVGIKNWSFTWTIV